MFIEKQTLNYCFSKAKEYYKSGDMDNARDFLDMGIAFVAIKKQEGMDGEDLIEDVKINLWLDRFWNKLENWGLLL